MLLLILQRPSMQPFIDSYFSAIKRLASMDPFQRCQTESLGKHDLVQRSPRIIFPSRFCAGVSFTGACNAFQKASCSSGLS